MMWAYHFLALPLTLLGAFLIFKVIIMPMKKPADTSNRIAHLRLVWKAINRPEEFVATEEYLKYDEF